MTKKEIKEALVAGKTMDDLFTFTQGQECMIFKGDFAASDEVCYIPDLDLNGIVTYRPLAVEEIEDAVSDMFTGNDFLELACGNEALARCVFDACDWQHPSTALVEFDDSELVEICGLTWKQLVEAGR